MSDETTMGPDKDPSDFGVKVVTDYLDGTEDPGEVSRVLSAEANGKNRQGIVAVYANLADPADEAAAVQAAINADHREDAEAMGYGLEDVTDAANNPAVVEV